MAITILAPRSFFMYSVATATDGHVVEEEGCKRERSKQKRRNIWDTESGRGIRHSSRARRVGAAGKQRGTKMGTNEVSSMVLKLQQLWSA